MSAPSEDGLAEAVGKPRRRAVQHGSIGADELGQLAAPVDDELSQNGIDVGVWGQRVERAREGFWMSRTWLVTRRVDCRTASTASSGDTQRSLVEGRGWEDGGMGFMRSPPSRRGPAAR